MGLLDGAMVGVMVGFNVGLGVGDSDGLVVGTGVCAKMTIGRKIKITSISFFIFVKVYLWQCELHLES